MRKELAVVFGMISVVTGIPAFSQTIPSSAAQMRHRKLGFVDSPASDSIVSGTVMLRVGRDLIMRPEWQKVALRIPGHADVFPASLPYDFEWNTRREQNGEKIVQIVLVDVRSGEAAVADSLDLWVRNGVVRQRPATVEPQPAANDVPQPSGDSIVITVRGRGPATTAKRPSATRPGALPALGGIGPSAPQPQPDSPTGDDPNESNGAAGSDGLSARPADEIRATFGRHEWYIRCGVLFHEDQMSQTTDAFLPWNESGITPKSVTATAAGATVETSRGSRTISIVQRPDSKRGYDGFIRVRLGSAPDRGQGTSAQKLGSVISSWQGVPYVWGGSSRSGTDCSGFVMAAYSAMGVGLPHGSMYLRTYRNDRPTTVVHDELRYGDILVYPGHCAIYTGEGTTAETVAGHVGRRTIWIRDSVVVRRFLNTNTERPWERSLYASRGGRRSRNR